MDAHAFDCDALRVAEPLRVVDEELEGDRVDVVGVDAVVLRVCGERVLPLGSRCQSIDERRSMPTGMLRRQNSIGSPTTSGSRPMDLAAAAVARPYGPAPMTSS
jgi:hypothetical protein